MKWLGSIALTGGEGPSKIPASKRLWIKQGRVSPEHRSDESRFNYIPSSRASFAKRSLCSAPVIASFICEAISLLCIRHRVLTARLLHHFAISTFTHHLRQHGKVIRNDGVVVIASFFCEAISLLCTRHRELLSRRDLFDLHPSSRASFAT